MSFSIEPTASLSPAPAAGMTWNQPREAPVAVQPCVSLPFTTPGLTGMRVRAAQKSGLEMLLSNPAGGRGFYIANWSTLRSFAAPSLHDIQMAERIAASVANAGPLSPAGIQDAAMAVAAEGHGGRPLAKAAQTVLKARTLGLRRIRSHLLLELARRLDLPGSHSELNNPWLVQPVEESGWLHEAPAILAGYLKPVRWQAATLDQAIATIATLAWPVGVGPLATRARLPCVLRLLRATRGTERALGVVGDAIEALIGEAEHALRRARAWFDDPITLLTAWREDGPGTLHILEQPQWLLDGWDRFCLMDGKASELAGLSQMLLQVEENSGSRPKRADADGGSPLARAGAAASFDMLGRNEAMRLREVQLHDSELAPGNG